MKKAVKPKKSTWKVPVLVITGFGVIGLAAALLTSASTPFMSIEPENGTIGSGATVVTDSGASSGKSVKFSGATSGQPKLRWSPPASSSWTTLKVGGNITRKEYVLAANTDYHIVFDSPAKARLTFVGGRNIKIIGGEINIASPESNTTYSSTQGNYYNYRNGLIFKGSNTGTIYIEGLHVHGQYALDSIQANEQSSRRFVIQNSRLESNTIVSGLTDVADKVYHTDGFQSWGGIESLYMNNVTIINPYQGGMFGDGALKTPWKTSIYDRVNFRGDTKAGQQKKLINFVTASGNLQGPFTFQGNSVYYQLGPNWTWTDSGATSGFYSNMVTFGSDSTGQYAEPLQSKVVNGINNGNGGKGRIYKGLPPAGDYAPASLPGMNYISPGYN